jgi:hypothetical protein
VDLAAAGQVNPVLAATPMLPLSLFKVLLEALTMQ